MAIIPNTFIDATTVIGDGNSWFATGFFVGYCEGTDDNGNNRYTTYLVTNKHVISNHTNISVQYNVPNNGVISQNISLFNNASPLFSEHPIKDVDVVAIAVNFLPVIQRGASLNFYILDQQTLDLSSMKNSGVCEGTIIYALGFPVGISSSLANNALKAPVCRMGCISKIEHLYHIKTDHAYLIDCNIYPGNSGSPIINRPEVISITNTPTNSNANLIGIVSGYLPYEDVLVSQQTGKNMMVTNENSGLAIVFPVDYIRDVILLERKRNTGLSLNQSM